MSEVCYSVELNSFVYFVIQHLLDQLLEGFTFRRQLRRLHLLRLINLDALHPVQQALNELYLIILRLWFFSGFSLEM